MTMKRFAPNAPYSDSIEAMSSKLSKKSKNIKINFTFPFFPFISKNKKLKNVWEIHKQNQD